MSAARAWLLLGAVNGLVAVAAGAYGRHRLEGSGEGSIDAFLVGVDYQMWHALALLATAWLADRWPESKAVSVAGGAFALGIVLFSGTLYGLGVTGEVVEGAAPAGAVALMVGWAALAFAALGRR